MQPVVQATTRTPGPSTADPVVNECRKPISPFANAVRTSVSGMSFARLTRISNGLVASSATGSAVCCSFIELLTMECSANDVHLLFARKTDEVDGITGYTNRETRIFLRMIDRIEKRFAVEYVDVHVKSGRAEERAQDRGEVGDTIFGDATQTHRH